MNKPEINQAFIPKVYFLRQVKEHKNQSQKELIDVLNEKVFLPESYINYFVLAEWNLKEEKLSVYFEKEQQPKLIKEIPFKINSNVKNLIK